MRPLSEFDPAWPHGHVTRDGKPARIAIKLKNAQYAYGVVYATSDGQEIVSHYTADGRFCAGSADHLSDLVNAPAPKRRIQGWVNLWAHDARGFEVGAVFATKALALAAAGFNERRLACIYIDVEEGEGLS